MPNKILIVQEYPDRTQKISSNPVAGLPGSELVKMLHEAGIMFTECEFLYVQPQGYDRKAWLKFTPQNKLPSPELLKARVRLFEDITRLQPKTIIALGDLALWALTLEFGIVKWRSSVLKPVRPEGTSYFSRALRIIPTYKPFMVLKRWDWRHVAVHDLRRAKDLHESDLVPEPDYDFLLRPSFDGVCSRLGRVLEMADKYGSRRTEAVCNGRTELTNTPSAVGRMPPTMAIRPSQRKGENDENRINLPRTANNAVNNETQEGSNADSLHGGISSSVNNNPSNREATVDRRSEPKISGEEKKKSQGVLAPHITTPSTASTAVSGLLLSGDIETRGGYIACFGIGWSRTEAMCVPFMAVDKPSGYWLLEEEQHIVWLFIQLFRHPHIHWVFQNGIYDLQYFAKWWGAIPNMHMDTMLAHHTCWSGLPKGLDFLSSLYCKYHRYWKDEGKEFHKSIKTPEAEYTYWSYNCKDCVTTYEVAEELTPAIKQLNQWEPYYFQMQQFFPVLHMMLRGVRVNTQRKSELTIELMDTIALYENNINSVTGQILNVNSPKQMQTFFYEKLGLPVQMNRKTHRPTTNDEALQTLASKEVLVRPLVDLISALRSLKVFLGTFIKAPVSEDKRMRSSYNIAGTETFRWSSSKDAFGSGMNLQNIPKGN